ncbi:MAG: hypothetical protein ACTHJ0_12245, partial [Flavipsychrobacter sp.]
MPRFTTAFVALALALVSCQDGEAKKVDSHATIKTEKKEKNKTAATTPAPKPAVEEKKTLPPSDTALYTKLMLHLVHDKPNDKWPVKTGYPLPGAILPYKRIVAYYGNFYSKGMGILGALPVNEMIA